MWWIYFICAHHIRTICSSTTCMNSRKFNKSPRTNPSQFEKRTRSIYFPTASDQLPNKTEDRGADVLSFTEEAFRKLACALLTLRALSTESCRWDEKNFSFLFLPALCARSGPSWERERARVCWKRHSHYVQEVIRKVRREKPSHAGKVCYQEKKKPHEHDALRGQIWASNGLRLNSKLQNVVVVIFLFLEHLRRFI